MNRIATIFPLFVFLLPHNSQLYSQSVPTDSTRFQRNHSQEFWKDLEDGVNQFINKMTRRFDDNFLEDDSLKQEQPNDVTARSTETARQAPWQGNRPSSPGSRHRIHWINESTDLDHVVFRYNRVEGFFLGIGSEKKYYWNDGKAFAPFGSLGYGFASHTWRGNLGITRQMAFSDESNSRLLEFGVEGYSLTDTKDQWIIRQSENTLASLFTRQDFRDYFEKQGVAIHSAYYIQNPELYFEGRLVYSVDRYNSLDNETGWALFGGKRRFRDNPSIDGGRINAVRLLAGLSTTSSHQRRPKGWSLQLTGDIADEKVLGGNLSFSRYVAEVRRYQPLTKYDQMNLRLRLGSSLGTLPRQMSYDLGGLSTMPAFAFKSFPAGSLGANRMILLNTEYLVNGDLLGDLDFWPSWLMKHVNLLFLADAGWMRTVNAGTSVFDGFGGIQWSDFKSDLGVGVTNRTGSWRLAIMWRTDKAESPSVYFRVAAPF